MASTTSAGTKLAVTAAAPATYDAAGFAALTFTTVKGVESIPELGVQSGVISFQPLDGEEEQHKGPVSYGQITVPAADDPADAGQTLLKTAATPGNNAKYSFKKTHPDGFVEYWQQRVFAARTTTGGASNVRMRNFMIGVGKVVEVAPT